MRTVCMAAPLILLSNVSMNARSRQVKNDQQRMVGRLFLPLTPPAKERRFHPHPMNGIGLPAPVC